MMNLTRRRLTVGAALMAATFFVLSVGSAQAQSRALMATIPFGFYAGETQLPAGDYRVDTIGSGVVKLFNRDTHTPVIFHTNPVRNSSREPVSAKLVFHRYGQEYFLSEMWWSNQDGGRETQLSKRERQLAKTAAPARIESVAHR